MTGMVTVRLILYGLIAFAPNSNDSPTTINALLVDARGPQYASDGCKIPPHMPVLFAAADSCTVDGLACTVSEQVEKPRKPAISGAWLLDRESLSVEVVPAGEAHARKLIAVQGQKVASSLPANPTESSLLHWIPQMRSLLKTTAAKGPSLAKDCLHGAQNCPIVARLAIDDGRVTSCHLSEEITEEKVYPFAFKPIGTSAKAVLTQAMSDAVMVSFQVSAGSEVQIVSLDLEKKEPKRKVVLKAGEEPTIDIWVTNVPSQAHQAMEDPTCHNSSNYIDRHFQLYYNLLDTPIPFSKRAVPHRLVNEKQVLVAAAAQPKGGEGCPVLTFLDDSTPIDIQLRSAEFRDYNRVPYDWKSCGNVQVDPKP